MSSQEKKLRGIRINEIYGPTFQAEGPFSGYKTLFLRTSGCNLRCHGWGVETELPDGTVVTGCDTPRAVFPQLYKGTPFRQPEEIVEDLKKKDDVKRVCLTGGEPLFGDKASINALLDLLYEEGYVVDVFTNGTQDFSKFLEVDSERRGSKRENVNFVVDFKMPGSGEYNSDDAKSIKQGKVFLYENVKYLRPTDAVKFVIKDRHDFDVAVQEYHEIKQYLDEEQKSTPPQFFAGAVFGLMDNDTLMDWVLETRVPFQFQFQEHKYNSNLDQKELENRLDLPIAEVTHSGHGRKANKNLLTNIRGSEKYEGPKHGQ